MKYLRGGEKKVFFFFTFPLDSKNRRFALLQRVLFLAVISENAAFRIFRERKCLKSLKLKMMDRCWGGQSESAYISLELKIAILLLLTSQH